ncbi:MAG: LamG domain-containing protein [Tannerellaceae bacterium]|nr:LamG domain-containing protein [Tannerellaceae bacterium]
MLSVKQYLIPPLLFLPFTLLARETTYQNKAIRLEGNDNYLCMGMDIIREQWTLEAWVKGENGWKETEVIIGGGEYSNLSYVDPLVLVIKNGRVTSEKAGIQSNTILDDKWHHIALSCDGKTIRLYVDGRMEASREFVTAILPGVLGAHMDTVNTYCGLLDEVRIWSAAIPAKILQEWKSRPLQSTHPFIQKLEAYYTFDEEIDDTVINWVGKGHLSYHIRNVRNQRERGKRLAYTVPADNPHFAYPGQEQALFNAVVIDSEWDVAPRVPGTTRF